MDINDLCAEFTNKARCDGTKIVLDKQGVNYIIARLSQKYAAQQQSGTAPVNSGNSASASA